MKDREIAELIEKEKARQSHNIEMIASENYVSQDILKAVGSILTNKYAEGYPHKRYYGGCVNIDGIESLAIARAKEPFRAEHANVQPHCGSSANMGVYMTVLKPGDKVLGMDLSAGGHLTHGHPLSFSGQLYEFYGYGVDRETETIDYINLEKMAFELQPKLIVAGASAYPRFIDFAKIREICDNIGAYMMVDMAHIAGMVAAELHPSPVPYADFVSSTTHKTLRGPRGGLILCKEEQAQNLDRQIFPGIQGGPLEHVIAGKAICFYEALQADFLEYQRQLLSNTQAMVKTFMDNKVKVVSQGSDTHLLLVDVKKSFSVTGKEAEKVLDEVCITCNKNSIPFDEEKPMTTSGIRLGSPAMTTRGFKEAEFIQVTNWIIEVLKDHENQALLAKVKAEVLALTEKYPIG